MNEATLSSATSVAKSYFTASETTPAYAERRIELSRFSNPLSTGDKNTSVISPFLTSAEEIETKAAIAKCS